jgi:hypothetical protein
MRVCDLPESEIKVGLRVRSLADSNRIGEIISVTEVRGDMYSWILWPGETHPHSGFFWNHCTCEVVESP